MSGSAVRESRQPILGGARNVAAEPAFWGRRPCTGDLFHHASPLPVMSLEVSLGKGQLHV
jgi:hypothetical protein